MDHFKKNNNINKKHIKLCFCNNRVIEINFEIVYFLGRTNYLQ